MAGLGKVLGAAGAVAGGLTGGLPGAAAGASLGQMAGGMIAPERMNQGFQQAAPRAAPLRRPQFSETPAPQVNLSSNGRMVAEAMQSLDQLPQDLAAEYQPTLATALMRDIMANNDPQVMRQQLGGAQPPGGLV
jgi:hypothetical protein